MIGNYDKFTDEELLVASLLALLAVRNNRVSWFFLKGRAKTVVNAVGELLSNDIRFDEPGKITENYASAVEKLATVCCKQWRWK
jgi:hypothetical protein